MRHPAALALAALALAGCLGPPDAAAPPPGPGQGAAPASFALEGCEGQAGVFPMAMDVFAAIAPEGFAAVPFDPAGRFATEVVSAHACTQAGEAARDLLALVLVEPPAELAGPDASSHALLVGAFVTHPEVHAALAAWGAGDVVRLGTISVQRQALPLGAAGRAEGASEGFRVTLTTAVEGPESSAAATTFRVFAAAERSILAAFDVDVGPRRVVERGQAALDFTGFPGPLPVGAEAGTAVHAVGDYAYLYRRAALPAGP